ncbi:hypothetical protein ACOSQ2_019374 [Xanthoceras sorbifolium]
MAIFSVISSCFKPSSSRVSNNDVNYDSNVKKASPSSEKQPKSKSSRAPLVKATTNTTLAMAIFSVISSCFKPSSSSSSSRVSNNDVNYESDVKKASPSSEKQPKSKSSRAPIVVSYFPINSSMSRL